MTKGARTIVRPAHGKSAIRLGQQDSHHHEPSSKPARSLLTRAMFGRVAIVVFICAFVAAHAWAIYKIETSLQTRLPVKDATPAFGE